MALAKPDGRISVVVAFCHIVALLIDVVPHPASPVTRPIVDMPARATPVNPSQAPVKIFSVVPLPSRHGASF